MTTFPSSLFQFEVNDETFYIAAPSLEEAYSAFKLTSEQSDFDSVHSLGMVTVSPGNLAEEF